MVYKLLYTKSASDDIHKLDKVVKQKIGKKLLLYSQNPLQNAKKLVDSSTGNYRWRVGNYRIVFDLDGQKIIVLKVGHRREIYR